MMQANYYYPKKSPTVTKRVTVIEREYDSSGNLTKETETITEETTINNNWYDTTPYWYSSSDQLIK